MKPYSDKAPYLQAEIGINHQGEKQTALAMIESAASHGADGVKFQAFKADTLINEKRLPDDYAKLKAVELDYSWLPLLRSCAKSNDVDFICTPFDLQALDTLIEIGADAIKIASGDITFDPLLRAAGRSGLPVILSTGASNMQDIHRALDIIDCADVTLLHCVSLYPTLADEVNLHAIVYIGDRLNMRVGFSDHTIGIWAATAAVALGACLIEKHFTLDHSLPGDDHAGAAEPDELARLKANMMEVALARGNYQKLPTTREKAKQAQMRRGLYHYDSLDDVSQNELISTEKVRFLRPENARISLLHDRDIKITGV